MVRRVIASLLGLFLLTAGIGHPAGGEPPVRIAPDKTVLALVVKLRVPRDEPYDKVKDILDRIKTKGATHMTLRVSEASEGLSAEVVAQPKTPSKRVAAVVEELLEGGIKKISVEVKK